MAKIRRDLLRSSRRSLDRSRRCPCSYQTTACGSAGAPGRQNISESYRRDIVEDDRIYVPAGEGRVAFIDARDIGEVAALALTEDGHRGQAYHLAGPEALTIDAVATIMSEVLGRTVSYEPAPAIGYFRHLRKQGLVIPQAVVQTILRVGLRKGDAEPVTDDVERLLGRPARTVREYVTDHTETWASGGSSSN